MILGKSAEFSLRKSRAIFFSSAKSNPKTRRPLSLYFLYNSERSGISSRQDWHPARQNISHITFPRWSESLNFFPSDKVRSKSGASVPGFKSPCFISGKFHSFQSSGGFQENLLSSIFWLRDKSIHTSSLIRGCCT